MAQKKDSRSVRGSQRGRIHPTTDAVPAKRSLGQHFLSDPAYLSAIADAADIHPGDTVLEIGTGKGGLTAELLGRGGRVVAVEKDRRLIPLLKERFRQELPLGALTLIESDALEFDPALLGAKKYILVGNIPYYLTGALFRKFLSEKHLPAAIVFLLQKEVAERIAKDQKESILSLSTTAYGTPAYNTTDPRGAFSPPPLVDSAGVAITNISRSRFRTHLCEQQFFSLLHAGFGHKRKFLARNLEPLLGDSVSQALRDAIIHDRARAEDIPVEKWLLLARATLSQMLVP